jgi:hypothetical protein
MIVGTAVMLKATQQERITTWMTKCAMIFDGMDRGDVFYDGLDRLHFMNRPYPLCDTLMWLGHYTGEGRSICEHRTLRTRLRSGELIKTHVLTMTVGRLALQIASVKRVEYKELTPWIDLPTYGPSLNDALIQIWPMNLKEVSWPPKFCFNDSDRHLKLLAYRFGGDRRAD